MKVVRRRYHLGAPGLIYISIMLLLGIGALNSANNLLYLVFGIAAAALIVSGFVSGAMMMGLSVKRATPDAGAVGQPLSILYIVTNRSTIVPGFALTVEEIDSSGRRRAVPTWPALMERPRAFIMHVGARETVRARAVCIPTRRGRAVFTTIRLSSTFPFGLVRKSITVRHEQAVDILPRVERVRRDIIAQVMSRGEAGERATNTRGIGDDFYGLREYQPGDSLKSIAWKPSARLGEVVVRENVSTAGGRLWVLLSFSALPKDEALAQLHTEQAVTLAASFVVDALAIGTEAGFMCAEQGVVCAPSLGARQRINVLTALARIDATAPRPKDAIGEREMHRLVGHSPCIAIHAGDLDPSVAPTGARHLAVTDYDRIITTEQDIEAQLRAGRAEEAQK